MPVRQKQKLQQNKTPNEVNNRDNFQTPRYAIDILKPYIPENVKTIWDGSAGYMGSGNITKFLSEYGYEVMGTDINSPKDSEYYWNFLDNRDVRVDCIIQNPPFSLKKDFFYKCLEYNVPFALLIPCDVSGWLIDAYTKYNCKKIIPTRRINYLTPNMLSRINEKENQNYSSLQEIPTKTLNKYTSSNFHSMWLCSGFNLDKQETYVELSTETIKTRIF
jgi:hypothetical protein